MDDGERERKGEKERDQYEDKVSKTSLEMNCGKTGENDGGDGIDRAFR